MKWVWTGLIIACYIGPLLWLAYRKPMTRWRWYWKYAWPNWLWEKTHPRQAKAMRERVRNVIKDAQLLYRGHSNL